MKGFTITETIVAIFIFSVLSGAIFATVYILYTTYSYQWQQSLAIAEARRGIEIMAREIREARESEEGNYPIEYAGDKEFIFYADVDDDGRVERVRYFLGEIQTETIVQECESYLKGGSCSVTFSDFIKGNLKEAVLKISAQGDLNSNFEYLTVTIDNQTSTTFCQNENCSQCPQQWQIVKTFDVKNSALDNQLPIFVQSSCSNPNIENRCVDPRCPFSFKVKFELTLTQEIYTSELKKGIIKPRDTFPFYPSDQEKISIITHYVRNAPPIFEYFDEENQKIEDYPARTTNAKVMKVFLIINVDPNKPPVEFQLRSYVQIRNLKN